MTMRSHGKLNPLDQANLEARRKTRRGLTIIGLSTSALVAIIVISVLAVNHSSDDSNSDDSNNNASPFSTSIKAMCDATLYPSSYMDSLSPVANSTELDPVKLFNLTLQVAINGITKVSDNFRDLRTNDTMSPLAVANCNELIELAIDHLNDCVTSSIDFRSEELVDDIKTWLSSAITTQQTCIDGFNNSTELMRNSTEFASNRLAIFTNLHNLFGSFKLRRLLSNGYNPTPSWLSTQEWRLL